MFIVDGTYSFLAKIASDIHHAVFTKTATLGGLKSATFGLLPRAVPLTAAFRVGNKLPTLRQNQDYN